MTIREFQNYYNRNKSTRNTSEVLKNNVQKINTNLFFFYFTFLLFSM